ncbi:MAG TPA: DUF4834 family protein [Panacibacter sp.]|nr:DUF4834 family protein [Panacibacter sp.]
MIEVVGTILILYLIYKLVFDFIVPVSKTTSQFKEQVNEIKRQQEEKMRRQQSGFSQAQPPKAAPKEKGNTTTTTDGEYIDYEEIK